MLIAILEDDLNAKLGVLTRREVEARILIPVINALEIDVIEESDEVLSFNVTRCRYAELYKAQRMK